jgi:hypothetical protein
MLTYREALAQAMAMQRFPGAGVLGSAQTMNWNSKSTGTVYAQKPLVTRGKYYIGGWSECRTKCSVVNTTKLVPVA